MPNFRRGADNAPAVDSTSAAGVLPPAGVPPPAEDAQADWVSYACKAASTGAGCSVRWSVQQSRLHALIGVGLEQAFQAHGIVIPQNVIPQDVIPQNRVPISEGGLPHSAEPCSTVGAAAPATRNAVPEVRLEDRPGARLDALVAEHLLVNKTIALASQETLNAAADHARTEALIALEAKRARYLELYAGGLIRDKEELGRFLAQVDKERLAVAQPRLYERVTSSAATRLATIPEVRKL